MSKFIITTCLMLFWAFYEMSGGADFVPLERKVVAKAPVADMEQPPLQVTRQPFGDPAFEVLRASYVPELIIEPAQAPVVENVTYVASDVPLADTAGLPVWKVDGDWVNMRDGPSTSFAVLDTLPRGTKAEIIDTNGDGWAQIRLIDSGQTGWMAARLLSDG